MQGRWPGRRRLARSEADDEASSCQVQLRCPEITLVPAFSCPAGQCAARKHEACEFPLLEVPRPQDRKGIWRIIAGHEQVIAILALSILAGNAKLPPGLRSHKEYQDGCSRREAVGTGPSDRDLTAAPQPLSAGAFQNSARFPRTGFCNLRGHEPEPQIGTSFRRCRATSPAHHPSSQWKPNTEPEPQGQKTVRYTLHGQAVMSSYYARPRAIPARKDFIHVHRETHRRCRK